MSLIVAGVFRLPPGNVAAARPHMVEVMEATRSEDGCLAYAYAEDIAEPGLIRVYEMWRDQAALDAHFKTPHMGRWRAARDRLGLSERCIFAYEVASEREL